MPAKHDRAASAATGPGRSPGARTSGGRRGHDSRAAVTHIMPMYGRHMGLGYANFLIHAARMTEEDLTIKLSKDQAFVLSDWLDRMIGTPEFDSLANQDRAVWSPLYAIAGTLDKSLVEIFLPDYTARLNDARERLLESLGDIRRSALEK